MSKIFPDETQSPESGGPFDVVGRYVIAIVIAFPIYVGITVLLGAALASLWGWFVSEPFGVVHIGWVHAAGLSCILSVLRMRMPRRREENDDCVRSTTHYVLGILLAWILGYAIHLFM